MTSVASRRLLGIILVYTALSFYEPFWRLTMRAPMQGKRFAWDYAGIGGQGATGGYPVVVLISAIGLVILALGWRKPGHRFFRWAVLAWACLKFLSSLAIVIAEPGLVLQGETLRLEIPFAWTVFPADLLYFAAVLIWFWRAGRERKEPRAAGPDKPAWTPRNTAFLVLALLLVPVEALLFNAGELHGPMDQAAVALTFAQYAAINLSLVPWRKKAA